MASDPNCIFCKIVAGQIPCWKLHEDERVLAFLDVGPLSEGHTLIIPRQHYATLDQMSDEDAAACAQVMPRLARAVCSAAGVKDYNLLQNNGRAAQQSVLHVHFHIIPRTGSAGLGISWPAGKLNDATAKRLQEAIMKG